MSNIQNTFRRVPIAFPLRRWTTLRTLTESSNHFATRRTRCSVRKVHPVSMLLGYGVDDRHAPSHSVLEASFFLALPEGWSRFSRSHIQPVKWLTG